MTSFARCTTADSARRPKRSNRKTLRLFLAPRAGSRRYADYVQPGLTSGTSRKARLQQANFVPIGQYLTQFNAGTVTQVTLSRGVHFTDL